MKLIGGLLKRRRARKARKEAKRRQRIEAIGRRKAKNHAKVKGLIF